jgi:hypothetical protein
MLLGAISVSPALAAEPAERAKDPSAALARVERCIEAWQLTRAERCLDQVGWARDLREALKLAKDSGRPVFVFTYNGCATRANALALQRC